MESPVAVTPQPDWHDPWRRPDLYTGLLTRRVIAYGVDGILMGLLGYVTWTACAFLTVLTLGLFLPVASLLLACVPIFYHILSIGGSKSATPGMRLMDLIVVVRLNDIPDLTPPSKIQAGIMAVCFYGSMALTGGLVLLIALFNNRRRLLHDYLAGTMIVRASCLADPLTPP